MARPVFLWVVLGLGIGLVNGACSSDDKGYATGDNGVNDVRAACQMRSAWKSSLPDCASCETMTQLQRCECSAFEAFGAACYDQAEARRKEPTCTEDVDTCLKACVKTDCACIDGCYANKDACRRASAARDGCVAEVCDKYCH